jgi:protein-tyrosine phosphatase
VPRRHLPFSDGRVGLRRPVTALQRRGYHTAHRARQYERTDVADRDLIVALDEDNGRDLHRLAPDAETVAKIRLLRAFDPAADGDLVIPDPNYGTDADFEHAFDLIEAGCGGLVVVGRGSSRDIGPTRFVAGMSSGPPPR